MKKIFTLIFCFMALFSGAMAQTPILNQSFENWTTVNGKMYPNNWGFLDTDSSEIKDGYTQRVSGGSAGTYAIQLSSYLENSAIVGAEIEIEGAVTLKPKSILFDYKVANATASNGIEVDVHLWDASHSFDSTYTFVSKSSNSSYKTGSIDFNLMSFQTPTNYSISIFYLNLGGNLNESATVDNIRFSQTAEVKGIAIAPSSITICPNPAIDLLTLNNPAGENIRSVRFNSVDGRSTFINVENSTVDVSSFNRGIYVMEILDDNGHLLKREKVNIH
jgi:hypothetical protein